MIYFKEIKTADTKEEQQYSLILRYKSIFTCNVCKLAWAVCITEFGLLTSMTFPFEIATGWMFVAVWMTDCWLGCITDCT